MQDERRHAKRIPVSVFLDQHVEGQSHRCCMTELSATGLFMERPISSFVRHSAKVQLEIAIPDGESEPVWATGEIVYDCFDAVSHGTAVRFDAIATRDRQRLDAYLSGVSQNRAAA